MSRRRKSIMKFFQN